MNAGNHGLQALENQVLKKDLCTLCGACAALCPYLRVWRGRIVKMDSCTLSEGRCFEYCPRTGLDLEGMNEAIFGQDYLDVTIGTVRHILMARSADPDIRDRAQTGGAVSTLIHAAMQKGVINKAVLTHRDNSQRPEGYPAKNRDDILRCAGSIYSAVPGLEAFNKGDFGEGDRIGLVGIPCQVQALGKMRISRIDRHTPIDQMALVIGLFCTWALDDDPFMTYIRNRIREARIRKMDITPPPDAYLKVMTEEEVVTIPLEEIRPFIRPACGKCLDMTSEFADLSVGTVEGEDGWNTVIIRTELGEDIVKHATSMGTLDTRPFPETNLDHLKEAALLKKRRAIKAIRNQEETDWGYISDSRAILECLDHKY